ncbi:hypothetical protein [Serratia marcescens]|jgi:hypothetical protein|uniref:hypothetical protein n=1 Tax=Serratia marcescens TaxID=615 RepID=UPI001F14DAE5|nr:hypothetical protein [Serratia marcescens]
MIYVLTAVLLLAILLFASGIYRLERTRADYEASTGRPENLRFILKDMLRTVQTEGTWDRVEFMRDEVRQALRTLDDMRHDRSNEGLRASKRQLEAQRQ